MLHLGVTNLQSVNMEVDVYKKNIEALLMAAEVDGPTALQFRTLTEALGCPGIRYYNKRWHVDLPYSPPAQDSAFVSHALTIALQLYLDRPSTLESEENTLSILTGLGSDGRWQTCLETIDSSYNLVRLLLKFAEIQSTPITAIVRTTLVLYTNVVPMVTSIFNDWVRPEVRLERAPDANLLLRSLFGNSWYDIFAGSLISLRELSELIAWQRPPFSANLLACQVAPMALTLPEIG